MTSDADLDAGRQTGLDEDIDVFRHAFGWVNRKTDSSVIRIHTLKSCQYHCYMLRAQLRKKYADVFDGVGS